MSLRQKVVTSLDFDTILTPYGGHLICENQSINQSLNQSHSGVCQRSYPNSSRISSPETIPDPVSEHAASPVKPIPSAWSHIYSRPPNYSHVVRFFFRCFSAEEATKGYKAGAEKRSRMSFIFAFCVHLESNSGLQELCVGDILQVDEEKQHEY